MVEFSARGEKSRTKLSPCGKTFKSDTNNPSIIITVLVHVQDRVAPVHCTGADNSIRVYAVGDKLLRQLRNVYLRKNTVYVQT